MRAFARNVCVGMAGGGFALSAAFAAVALIFGWAWAWPGHDHGFYMWPAIGHPVAGMFSAGLLVAILFLIMRLMRTRPQMSLAGMAGAVTVVFLLTVGLRATLLCVFGKGAVPYSDFQWAFERATASVISGAGDNHRWYPAWMNFSLWLKGLVALFGERYWAVLLIGMVFDGFTAAGVFMVLRSNGQPLHAAVFGSALYAVNPSSVAYGMTATPEHVSIACYVWATYFYLRAYSATRWRHLLLNAVLAGCLVGCGDAMKPFLPVLLGAFALALLLSPLRFNGRQWLAIVALVVVAKSIVFLWTTFSEREFEIRLDNATAYPYYLYVGCNRQGEGQIHLGSISRLYIKDLNNGMPLQQACSRAFDRVMSDWEGHEAEMPSFVMKKLIWAWQDDLTPLRYFGYSVGARTDWAAFRKASYVFMREYLPSISQFWYLTFMSILALLLLRRSVLAPSVTFDLLVVSLICIGFYFVTLAGEAQSRYKCLVLPFSCVAASMCMRKDAAHV